MGEYLTLLSVFAKNTTIAFVASTGVILAASYMLLLYKNVFLGPVNDSYKSKKISDINIFENSVYIILIILIVVIGIKPNFILDFTTSSIERIIELYPISIL